MKFSLLGEAVQPTLSSSVFYVGCTLSPLESITGKVAELGTPGQVQGT